MKTLKILIASLVLVSQSYAFSNSERNILLGLGAGAVFAAVLNAKDVHVTKVHHTRPIYVDNHHERKIHKRQIIRENRRHEKELRRENRRHERHYSRHNKHNDRYYGRSHHSHHKEYAYNNSHRNYRY